MSTMIKEYAEHGLCNEEDTARFVKSLQTEYERIHGATAEYESLSNVEILQKTFRTLDRELHEIHIFDRARQLEHFPEKENPHMYDPEFKPHELKLPYYKHLSSRARRMVDFGGRPVPLHWQPVLQQMLNFQPQELVIPNPRLLQLQRQFQWYMADTRRMYQPESLYLDGQQANLQSMITRNTAPVDEFNNAKLSNKSQPRGSFEELAKEREVPEQREQAQLRFQSGTLSLRAGPRFHNIPLKTYTSYALPRDPNTGATSLPSNTRDSGPSRNPDPPRLQRQDHRGHVCQICDEHHHVRNCPHKPNKGKRSKK
ncbi:uncharacterized protein PAC_17677 [Phialocephala subalpina]|uniref:Uncharacterized protein n=1 Tax=Phialocephala subalpina TaxID=576137 RepID=A0A1L7XS32_9HELO|nr:uncharacterized protein PAC_17677 [Phialocephala subalpina]